MVMSAGTPGGAYQADVWRAYLECEVPRVTRAAFDRWFDAPLEQCMAALAERALAYARAQAVDLPGPLSGVKDWYIVDSTTVTVRDALIEDCPGTGDYAAINVHHVARAGAAWCPAYGPLQPRPRSMTAGTALGRVLAGLWRARPGLCQGHVCG